jgi:hypothetical protein
VSERCFGVRSTLGEGHNAAHGAKGTTATGRKKQGFLLGFITATQNGCSQEVEALSSACQIVNERLMRCV